MKSKLSGLRNLRTTHRILIPVLAVILAVVVLGGAVMAASYVLNKEYSGHINVAPIVPLNRTLTINVVGNGTTAGQGTYTTGETATLTATPATGWQFDGWTGDVVSLDNPTTTAMSVDKAVTATFSESPLVVELYTDLDCTIVQGPTIELGTVQEGSGPITKVLYFKASKSALVPGGYGLGGIDPSTVTAACEFTSPGVATFTYAVGEPFGMLINGNHPCMLLMTITPVGAGDTTFTVHVTGTGS